MAHRMSLVWILQKIIIILWYGTLQGWVSSYSLIEISGDQIKIQTGPQPEHTSETVW